MKPSILNLIMLVTSFAAFSQTQPMGKASFVTSSDGIPIAYEVHGEETETQALVFVHGWSCDRSYWKGQLQTFSKHHKVITVDLGGHGESGLGRQEWTIYSFGSDVAAVVNRLGLRRVILIGHSMGGDVIADAARQLPGRVEGLIMVDTYKKLGPGRTPEQVQAFVNKFRTNFADSVRLIVHSLFLPNADPSLVEYVAMDMSSAPPVVALSALESSFHHSREIARDLEELKLPVAALNPDNEPTNTASMLHHGVEVVIMPDAGHFMMMEAPERFNQILAATIKKLTR